MNHGHASNELSPSPVHSVPPELTPLPSEASEADALPVDTVSDIQTLRDILLSGIEDRMVEMERDLLPEEFANRIRSFLETSDPATRERFVTAIRPVVISAIVEPDPTGEHSVEKAIAPVVGKAASAAVLHAFNSRMASLSDSLSRTFSLEGLRWRWEAFRTGAKYADVVAKRTTYFKVTHVFLIDRASGLLMADVHAEKHEGQGVTEQSTAAYLTAIQDFAKDMVLDVSDQESTELAQIRFSDHTIYIEPGPLAYVAAVVHGHAPGEHITPVLRKTVRSYHTQHKAALRRFSQDANALKDHLEPLRKCLIQVGEPIEKKKTSPVFLMAAWTLFLLPFLVIAGLMIQNRIEERRERDRLQTWTTQRVEAHDSIGNLPGITLWNSPEKPLWQVDVDPIFGPSEEELRAQFVESGLDPDEVNFRITKKDFGTRDLLRRTIDAKPGLRFVDLVVKDDRSVQVTLERDHFAETLTTADLAEMTQIPAERITMKTTLKEFDEPEFMERRLLRDLRYYTQSPSDVQMELHGGTLVLQGHCVANWASTLSDLPTHFPGIQAVNTQQLTILDESWEDYLGELNRDSGVDVLSQEFTANTRTGRLIARIQSVDAKPQTAMSRAGNLKGIRKIENWQHNLNAIRSELRPPSTVTLSSENSELVVRGTAPLAWATPTKARLKQSELRVRWKVKTQGEAPPFPFEKLKSFLKRISESDNMALVETNMISPQQVRVTGVRTANSPSPEALLEEFDLPSTFLQQEWTTNERHPLIVGKRLEDVLPKGTTFQLEDPILSAQGTEYQARLKLPARLQQPETLQDRQEKERMEARALGVSGISSLRYLE